MENMGKVLENIFKHIMRDDLQMIITVAIVVVALFLMWLIMRAPRLWYWKTKDKVNALKIDIFFERVFITHNFGIRNAKPSLHCFELIKLAEKCNWDELVYVGDNPTKDFVNLNYVGAKTIRVLTGSYSELEADRGYDAQVSIPNLQSLDKAIQQFGLSC
jgi:hypothetical protein